MTLDIAERLRHANPTAGHEAEPDESLLHRIVSEPRSEPARRRRRLHGRGLVIALAVLIVLAGTAAAVSTFAVQYFGANDKTPTPAAIIAEIQRINAESSDTATVDAQDFVRLAAFDGPLGRITVYGAVARSSSFYCIASATGDRFESEGCGVADEAVQRVPYGALSGSVFGDTLALYGRLTGKTTRVDIRFEDGSVKAASVRAPFWIDVLGSEETTPGHRPTELIARDAGGASVATQELYAPDFTSVSAARAGLQPSDGTPGQNAMHTYLESILERGAAGMVVQVDLSKTRELERFDTPGGAFVVYQAPAESNGVCVAYGDAFAPPPQGSLHPDRGACFREAPTDSRPTPFAKSPPEIVALAPHVYLVEGITPPDAASIEVRFSDGSTERAPIVYRAEFATWVGPGKHPVGLVARDASGREVDSIVLDPAKFG